jgi:hypothetical protein
MVYLGFIGATPAPMIMGHHEEIRGKGRGRQAGLSMLLAKP